MTVTLQPLTRDNLWPVVELKVLPEQETFVAPNIDSIANAYVEPTFVPFAVYAGDDLAGFAMYGKHPDTGAWWVIRLMIALEHQGRGYGRAALENGARPDGRAHRLRRRSPPASCPANTVAAALYESLGFRLTGEEEDGEPLLLLRLADRRYSGTIDRQKSSFDGYRLHSRLWRRRLYHPWPHDVDHRLATHLYPRRPTRVQRGGVRRKCRDQAARSYVVPVIIEEQDAHGGHRLGARLAPAHARAFLARADQVLAGRFDHAGADIPAGGPIAVVGHAGGLVGEVGDLRVADGGRLAATRAAPATPGPGWRPARAKRSNCAATQAAVSSVSAPNRARPSVPDPLAGVEPIDDLGGGGEVLGGQVPDPSAPSPSTAICPAPSTPRRCASSASGGPKAAAVLSPAT